VASIDRRESRERALGLLYEAAAKHADPAEVLNDLVVAPDPYCVELVTLASQHHEESIARIGGATENWPIERIGVIDRLVMELALAELAGEHPPPRAVVLDEAVELAKMFSTESSGNFVNGVLAALTDPDRTS
jgi:N utilization substance protein B